MMRRRPVVVGLGALMVLPAVQAAQVLSQHDANAMADKVMTMTVRGSLPPLPDVEPIIVETSFTQNEANAYFKYYGPQFLPTGVVDPRVNIGESNRVSARAVVDLDAVRTARERGWLDPLAYVSGAVEVRMAGRLFAANGVGVVQFESASVGGVSVSEGIIQELITFYTATPENPGGYRLGEPAPLPANIRAVKLIPGSATVVQ